MKHLSFQEIIFILQNYWASVGCVVLQPYDMQVGAGTFHPATLLRSLGEEPWRCAYVQPSRRPKDGRYGNNPSRLQHYYQFQAVLKPSPDDIQKLYLESLQAIGINPLNNDIRFVEDDWESPTLGASGLGWEVWCNGLEVTQFTYFQQIGGQELSPITAEITYGLERIAMFVQGVKNIYDIDYNGGGSASDGGKITPQDQQDDSQGKQQHKPSNVTNVKYGDVFLQAEREFSAFNLEYANIDMLFQNFADAESQCGFLIGKQLPLPAYDECIKASHIFNLLDARKVISVTERASYISRVREMAKQCVKTYIKATQPNN